VLLPRLTTGLRASLSLGKPMQQGYAIHVKGKSGLKQTRVTLDCWAQHPEWPTLVVVGRVSEQEVSLAARAASNLAFFPPLAPPGAAAAAAGDGGKQQEQQQLVDAAHVRDLQAAASIHLCPSVREGFGHYLNEARAAGALVVTVDHPPMNELVTPATGLLVPPEFTRSEPGTQLGHLAPLNGFVSAEGLCKAVAAGLAASPAEQARMRAAVRGAYLADKAAFLHRIAQLKAFLQARADAAAAGMRRGRA
jgi:glycosyltransferase involved in cell wall biosynthesis